MKKMLAIALALMLVPFTAFGLEMLQDRVMDEVTGQAGVSINIDAVVSNLDIGVVSWGDLDGVGGFTSLTYDGNYNVFGSAGAGYVGLSGLNVTNLRVQARQDYNREAWRTALIADGSYGIDADSTADEIEDATMAARALIVATAAGNGDPTALPIYADYEAYSQGLVDNNQFITIDVATSDGTYGDSRYDAGTTFVRIGLGTWDVTMDSLTAAVELGQDKTLAADEILGDISMQGMQLLLAADSFVEIYADSGVQGVNIFMDVEVDALTFDTMAWGDRDGLGAGTTAGWVGLADLAITDMTMDGTIGIDVATNDATGLTYVAIGFDGMAVGMGSMSADVSLGATDSLDANQVLGSFYNGNMAVTIGSGAVNIYGRADNATTTATESGVTLNFTLADTTVHMDAASWGDADGAGAGTSAGYVGMTALDITGLAVSGDLTIDVGTAAVALGDYYARLMGDTASFVRLGLTDLTVDFATMDATCGLATSQDLATGFQTMGSLYIGSMSATVNGFVDILAH